MRVIVSGGREWTDYRTMYARLSQLPPGTLIAQGECRGADRMAKSIARRLGLPKTESFPADWNKYKLAAGAIRNRHMFNAFKPDLVLAFHADIANSKGTKDMVFNVAKPAGCPCEIIDGRRQVKLSIG